MKCWGGVPESIDYWAGAPYAWASAPLCMKCWAGAPESIDSQNAWDVPLDAWFAWAESHYVHLLLG